MKKSGGGLFIAFEGLDGSGACVQAALLHGILSKEGFRTHLTKEPTNNLIGGLIKASLAGEWKANSKALQLLFAADRAQHLETEIVKHLDAGRIVIADRYKMSSLAYGLMVDDIKWLEDINRNFIDSDLTFLIKVDPKICATRIKNSNYELGIYKDAQNLSKVWEIYEKMSKEYPDIKIIDGERSEMEIVEEILAITKKALKLS